MGCYETWNQMVTTNFSDKNLQFFLIKNQILHLIDSLLICDIFYHKWYQYMNQFVKLITRGYVVSHFVFWSHTMVPSVMCRNFYSSRDNVLDKKQDSVHIKKL